MERNKVPGISIALCVLILIFCPLGFSRVIYVDDNATGNNDGSTWEHAYHDLQSALDAARVADEIRVAGGTYRPSKLRFPTEVPQRATFRLVRGVALRGGFAGCADSTSDARDLVRFESILSGDLKGDDVDGTNREDNSFHVVTGDDADATTILEGFTVTAGVRADGGSAVDMPGGGMYIHRGSPVVVRCTFRRNHGMYGGGVWNDQGGGRFVDCTFTENTASYSGGGLENYGGQLELVGCTFSRNAVDRGGSGGGAVYNARQGHMRLTGCRFVANLATYGGAMKNVDSTAVLQNCIFTGNRTHRRAYSSVPSSSRVNVASYGADLSEVGLQSAMGRVWSGGSSGAVSNSGSLTMLSCTVAGNSSDRCGGVSSLGDHPCTLVGCILWENDDNGGTDWSAQVEGAKVVAQWSCIQGSGGGFATTSNVDMDPVFARSGYWANPNDPGLPSDPRDLGAVWIEGDYHVKSQAGRWDPVNGDWVKDDATSPCIDAGDPMSPIGYEPFPNGGRINMGAYGGTAEGSKSYFGEPACQTIVAGDINGDCRVDFADFRIMALHWLQEEPGSGIINR